MAIVFEKPSSEKAKRLTASVPVIKCAPQNPSPLNRFERQSNDLRVSPIQYSGRVISFRSNVPGK